MSKYKAPQQSFIGQIVDIAFLIVTIFLALWLPLKLGLAGAAKVIDPITDPAWATAPSWELLKQNETMAAQWEKLGFTPETAHDIIQNHFHYSVDMTQLLILAVVLIGYFLFLFRASEAEYKEVIAEKFHEQGDK